MFPGSLGVTVRPVIGQGVGASTVVLDVSEALGIMLSLGVGLVGGNPKHRVHCQVQVTNQKELASLAGQAQGQFLFLIAFLQLCV